MDSMERDYLGISPPLSLMEPSNHEIKMSDNLIRLLRESDLYEVGSKSETVITSIESLVTKWIDNLSRQLGYDSDANKKAIVKVFGGHSFGVVMKGGDVDLVTIVPNFVPRAEFFEGFPKLLQQQQEVTNIRVIAAAYVPIVKFHYQETEIDMCLAVLTEDTLRDDLDLLSDDILSGMDPLSVRSLSGVRENITLLSLVPDQDNFCSCLKVIKYWAKRRGLHHYGIGFLGGISWAILVARVQQLYPNASVAVLVQKFFKIYLEWQWSTPVLLRPLQENTLKLSQWNPQVSTSDARHPMAVITPSYPEHNSAFTATQSTITIIQQELARGVEITENIMKSGDWQVLFQPIDIGQMYKHYLIVCAKARSDKELSDWSGLVESRLRILTNSLEKQAAIQLVHPYPFSHTFPTDKNPGDLPSTRWLLGLILSAEHGAKLSLAADIKQFKESVEALAAERHLFKQGMTLEVRHVKRKQLADHFPLNH